MIPGRVYLFSELGREHQREVEENLDKQTARTTRWVFDPEFPTEHVVVLAIDTKHPTTVRRENVLSVSLAIIERGGVIRPILVDDRDRNGGWWWMEGRHRSLAAEMLGMKTVPVLRRV